MSVVCRRAQVDDRDVLMALWQEAFGDAQDEIEQFFERFDYVNTAFVLCEEDRICSMLFLLQTAVQDVTRRFTAGYIYAGATFSEMRGKGYYRRLLAFVTDKAKQEGTEALLLRPATELLAESYRRMGFTVPLYGNSRPMELTVPSEAISATEYGNRRRKHLSGQAFVDWDDRTLAHAFLWCKANGNVASLRLFDEETLWESLPATEQRETALLMPLVDDFQTTTPIWFGYGLE